MRGEWTNLLVELVDTTRHHGQTTTLDIMQERNSLVSSLVLGLNEGRVLLYFLSGRHERS